MSVILHHKGAYNLYSTIVRAPCYDEALTLDELKESIEFQFGVDDLRDLPDRLARAHAKGTSCLQVLNLSDQIQDNQAGPGRSSLSIDAFIRQHLTLTVAA